MADSTDDPTHSPPRAPTEEVDDSAATSVAQEEAEDDAGVVVAARGTPQPNNATLVVARPGTPPPDMLLWNSAETLAIHPILYHAVMQVKRKIGAGTLSNSYRIVDHPDTDHRTILLSLRGSFKVQDFTTLDDVNIYTYAYADSQGIGFNLQLVRASTLYCQQHPSLEEALNTFNGMSYSAVLQESLEHELGHLKNHAELMNGCWTNKPEGPPLHAEAGFMVNERIRVDNQGDVEARVLEVPRTVQARGYDAPLGLIWGAFHYEEGRVEVWQDPNHVVTREELIQHMQYGGLPVLAKSLAGEEAAAEDQPGVEVEDGSRKRRREDEDGPTAGRCGNRRGRHSPGGLHPVVSRAAGIVPTSLALEPAETDQVAGKKEKQMAGMNKEEQKAGANEEEDLHQDYLALVDAGKLQLILETMPKTTVDAQFCDRDGRPRDSFTPSEEVYVLLTFTNPTSEDAYVKLYHGNFGRGAFCLHLEGEEGRYTPTARHQFVVKKLLPGASHTFAPRKFCGGRPDPGTRTNGFTAVPHWTPQNAGTYYATAWGRNVRFPLVIQQEDASNA